MPAIKLEQFGGMLPAWSDRLLPEGQASLAVNTYVFSGELRGWRQPKLLHPLLNSAAKFAYRVPIVTSAIAVAYLVFKSNPNAGDTVTLGEATYTFAASVVGAAPYTVAIGVNDFVTAGNLLSAVINSA